MIDSWEIREEAREAPPLSDGRLSDLLGSTHATAA